MTNSEMQHVNTDWLNIGREIFLYQGSDAYLYGLVCLAEIPTENFSSNEDDWLHYFCESSNVLASVPLRCLVMQRALNNSLAEPKDGSTIALIAKKIEELLPIGSAAKNALITAMGSNSRNSATNKLFFHLSTSAEKIEHFTDDTLDLSSDFHCNEITKDIALFSNLVDLNLSNCRLTDDDLYFLSGLKKLKSLNLSRNPISSMGLRHLSSAVLEILDLSETNFNASGTMQLRNLHSLRQLYLPSSFDSDSMKSLKNSLVECYITVSQN